MNLSLSDLLMWSILKEKIRDIKDEMDNLLDSLARVQIMTDDITNTKQKERVKKAEESVERTLDRLRTERAALVVEFEKIDVEIMKKLKI